MAVLGVIVILGFVVVPGMLQLQQNATYSTTNPVVMTWSGGKLTASDLQSKRHTRSSLLRFVQQLQRDALKKDPDVQLNTSIGIPNTDHPQSIVQTMLLAEKARSMGIVVSDQAINDYLTQLTDGVLTPREIVEAKRQALPKKWTEDMMFDALREELLAQKLRQMMFTATVVTTPVAAWEYHNRMERQVTAEFVPFPVADFVKDVKTEPTTREINELYEEHKSDYPFPESPEPGFKRWAEADFEYFVADYSKYLQEEKAKVTQQQIEKYYEDNKNSWRIDEEPAFEEPTDEEETTTDPDDPRGAEPKPPVPSSEEDSPAETTPPAEEEAAPPAGEEATLPPKEETEDAAGEPGAQGEAGDAGEEAAAEETAAEETPATDKPEVELPPVEVPAEDPQTTTDEDDLTAPPETAPKYKPLSEVEEDIRGAIASEPAQKRLAEAMVAARDALKKYNNAVVFHESDPDNSPNPGKFDYKQVAKQLGLGSGETGMIDALKLYEDKDLELGQSYRLDENFRGGRPQETSFAALAFDQNTRVYQPVETQTRGREKVFLSWKVGSKDAYVPKLGEVRDDVVKAWKLEQARKLAKEAAEKFAAEVKGDKSLKEQAGKEQKVLTPPPFTYFNPLSMWMFRLQGQQPQWEEIQGIEDGSADVIKKQVLAMPVGDVEVAENRAKSIYYVVRVAGDEGEEATRRNFMQSIVDSQVDGPPPELRYVGQNDQFELFQDWSEQLDKEFGLKWVDKEYLQRTTRGEE